ncbi:MAG: SulP family inorganic anion transporter [Bacteroidetes bacterium]|nr:SulP family inorganic anion transporter [Bacteroidota bacterium]
MFKHIKQDLPAGITVFLVAVPLCLGIALASGAPAMSGIIAGIIGGTVVAAISGSALGVSGPAAGLAIIVLEAINDLQNPKNAEPIAFEEAFAMFLTAVFIGGILQAILGALRAGIIGYYFPNSVIKGMLSGIGFVIFLKQIPHALGRDTNPEGDMDYEQPDGQTTFSEIWEALKDPTESAIIITVVALALLLIWDRKFIKKTTIGQLVPGPLLAVGAGIIFTSVFTGTNWELVTDHLVQIPLVKDEGLTNLLTFPDFSWATITNPLVLKTAVVIAVVASLETLLCLEATDKLDPHKRVSPPNRELIAQGAGNMLSGLIGGLPVTQVIVRSSANIQSGGQTKMAAIVHGLVLTISVLTIPALLNMVPKASLAAILFIVGYKLAKPKLFIEMYKKGPKQFLPFAVTFVVLASVDLLWGVGIGLAVAIFFILLNNYNTPFYYKLETQEGKIKIEMSEDVTFINKANIIKTLKELPADTIVEIDVRRSNHIHPDVLEIIDDFESTAPERNIELIKIGFENLNRDGITMNQQAEFQQEIEKHKVELQKNANL